MSTFATELKSRLDSRGWTEYHLAAAMRDAGLTPSMPTIANWLTGTSMPRLDHALVIARIFGVRIDDLVGNWHPARLDTP